ncbi:Cys-tRNA(Pro)/Cys-tRNA(Cys) deacylase YbaK [Arenicella sp. 4NH20-0111]|uniref:Cys-tRNA(Pro) deacylase n=1 Tax=Arenicella sp. 4NH20-0111 TaxID=3127648 RepID=UPI003103E853
MTPAIKVLEKQNIQFVLHSYHHDESAPSYGLEAVQELNTSADRVFKTLVTQSVEGHLVVAIVPVSGSLSLKKLSAAVGTKKIAMADKLKVQSATGYVIGGVSPVGQKRLLKTILDESAFKHDTIFISAGKRGLDLELRPSDLQIVCSAKTALIAASN